MTVVELITKLQLLGDKNLEKEVIMFDGPNYFTPCRVKVLSDADSNFGRQLKDKVLID